MMMVHHQLQSTGAGILFLFLGGVFVLNYNNVEANNRDLFNYNFNDESIPGGRSYGQQNWGSVTCDSLPYCDGWENKYLYGKGFSISGRNNCQWCVEGGPQNCGLHRQSPIDLKRDRGIPGHSNEKECPDWHYMMYRDDTCAWSDMKDQFAIERHALRLSVPIRPNGDIDCERESDGFRQFPRLDYSKGFPDWWWLDHTEITVPSSHTQEGKQYAAEVILAHFYEITHEKNQLGHISIFLQDYDDAEPWPFLDKLICQWRKEEEAVRSSCGLPPAPAYGRCSLFRGQDPAEEYFEEAGKADMSSTKDETDEPTESPTKEPDPTPSPAVRTNRGRMRNRNPRPQIPWDWESWGLRVDRVPTKAPSSPPEEEKKTDSETEKRPKKDKDNEERDFEEAGVKGNGQDTNRPDNSNSFDPANPPPIDCGASEYRGASYDRMCYSSDPCCEKQRSDTDFCWNIYENIFPGNLIYSACRSCCPDRGMQVGPPNPENPTLGPKTVQCSTVVNPHRMCKPNSCCENPRSNSAFCRDIYQQYPGDMGQICHYCCSQPKEVGPRVRNLRDGRQLSEGNTTLLVQALTAGVGSSTNGEVEEKLPENEGLTGDDSGANNEEEDEEDLPEGANATFAYGRKLLLRKENFDFDEEDEDEYFNRIYADFKHRSMQEANSVHEIDYADVKYWPYEWLIKVGTEYYFRYEGTQMVPPCWEVVHWRVLKDPIRVHKRQIAELNRLLAWRRSASGANRCELDTAGDVSDNGKRVDLSRRTQYYHTQHRKVFCECKDWPSKFENDKEWCRNWRNDPGYDRFFNTPYSFDTGGDW